MDISQNGRIVTPPLYHFFSLLIESTVYGSNKYLKRYDLLIQAGGTEAGQG